MKQLLELAARTDEHNTRVVMGILVRTCTASSALVWGDYASHVSAIKQVGSVLDSLLDAADECLPKPKLESRLLWIDFCVEQLVRSCNITPGLDQTLTEAGKGSALRAANKRRLTFNVPEHEVAAVRRHSPGCFTKSIVLLNAFHPKSALCISLA